MSYISGRFPRFWDWFPIIPMAKQSSTSCWTKSKHSFEASSAGTPEGGESAAVMRSTRVWFKRSGQNRHCSNNWLPRLPLGGYLRYLHVYAITALSAQLRYIQVEILSCDIMWSNHMISCDIILYHMISYRMTWYHTSLYQMISYHIKVFNML